ncbi:MAG: hypothetical protein NXI32_18035, partial [bacterium]|nr:hypothetical protein [bacterium]
GSSTVVASKCRSDDQSIFEFGKLMYRSLFSVILSLLLLPVTLWAEETQEKKITFDEHIKPIFREHCTACHSEGDKASDLALDSYAASLAGGSSGDVIAAGNTSGSRLWQLVTHAEQPYMPPDQDPIPKEQIALLKTWIEQGMPENAGSEIKRVNNAAAAMIQGALSGKPEGPPPMPEDILRQPILETSRAAAISAMAASPWAPLLAVGGQQQVSLYHAESGELLGIIPFPEGEPQALAFTRDGRQLLIGGGRHSHSGCAVLVDVASGRRITKVGDELDTVLAADISPDKSRIAIAGPQKIIRIFDSLSGEVVFELKKHTDWIYSLRFSPDGVLLASGDRSNGLILWEADTGNLYSELAGHKGEVRSLDFRGDSNVLASASLDGTIKLWDMYESREIKSWNAHAGGATAVAFANDGHIASAGRDRKVKLWDGNGQMQKEFQGLDDMALEVAITGDGSFVAAGDWSGAVRLWPTAKPEQIRFVAANPPSIDHRLAQAQQARDTSQESLQAAITESEAALAAAQQSEQQLKAAELEAQTLQEQLQQKTRIKNQLETQSVELDARIQELEKQLAESRQQRMTVQQDLQQTSGQLEQLQAQHSAAVQVRESSQVTYQQLAEAANAASEKRQAAELQLEDAKQALAAALADKQALEAKSKALLTASETAQQRVQDLTQKLAASAETQQAQKAQHEQMQRQLGELQQQLEELQQQMKNALEAQSKAQATLAETQRQNSELQQQLEKAGQEAQEAEQELQLFEQSYKRTN